LFPEVVTEGFVARGGEPVQSYSRAHLEAASKAVGARLKQSEQAKTWGEGDALSDLKLELDAAASPKMTLNAVYGSKGAARAYYDDLRGAWQAEAQEETRRASAVRRAGEGAISWTQKLRRALPEAGPKRALLFTAVAGVALGGVIAAQYWMRRRDRETQVTPQTY
jgi:hypothetical protein